MHGAHHEAHKLTKTGPFFVNSSINLLLPSKSTNSNSFGNFRGCESLILNSSLDFTITGDEETHSFKKAGAFEDSTLPVPCRIINSPASNPTSKTSS